MREEKEIAREEQRASITSHHIASHRHSKRDNGRPALPSLRSSPIYLGLTRSNLVMLEPSRDHGPGKPPPLFLRHKAVAVRVNGRKRLLPSHWLEQLLDVFVLALSHYLGHVVLSNSVAANARGGRRDQSRPGNRTTAGAHVLSLRSSPRTTSAEQSRTEQNRAEQQARTPVAALLPSHDMALANSPFQKLLLLDLSVRRVVKFGEDCVESLELFPFCGKGERGLESVAVLDGGR